MDGGGGCSGPVTVTFEQSGSSVSASLPWASECVDGEPVKFEGTLTGNVLKGRIMYPNTTFTKSTYSYALDNQLTIAVFNYGWVLRR